MKLFRITVTRPTLRNEEDAWRKQRDAFVTGDSFDAANKAAVAYYNDVEDVDDYYVRGVDIVASDEDVNSGGVLIQA